MARHEAIFAGYEELADATLGFRFERPQGFTFKAGQSVSLGLMDPPAEPNSARRVFSLASAPYEPHLLIATRMREGSSFKRALRSLPPGARVKLVGPLGDMTLHEDVRRAAVMIAGGIGITPFRSMLRQAAHEGLGHSLYLIHSNRRREHAAFLAELQALDEGAVRQFVGDARDPVYDLAGPPAMVAAMKSIVAGGDVAPGDVRSEAFFGY